MPGSTREITWVGVGALCSVHSRAVLRVHTTARLQFLHCTARFKVYLDETPIDFGLNFTDMVFGNGDNSLCGGGDGPMKVCELQP
jgi:hypothetical protein